LSPPTIQVTILFFAAKELEKADAGDESARRRVRILTPLIKFRACRDARKVTGDAMEVRGGCGYIEEWSDARLVRDAHLGSIWEGTSNIVALDVMRAIRREQSLAALHADLRARTEQAGPLRERLNPALERSVALAGDAQAFREALVEEVGDDDDQAALRELRNKLARAIHEVGFAAGLECGKVVHCRLEAMTASASGE
jgi:acyl-CoA dehydrogenase